MESIGDKLRVRREEEGYTLDQVTRDTNIAKSYLEALEAEDFAVFPGEPYLIGFLRNYSDYLGLDVDEIISLYKNFKIQEQPLPMDELIIKRGPSPLLFVGLGLLVVVLLVVGGVLLYPGIAAALKERSEAGTVPPVVAAEPEATVSEGERFVFSDEITEQRFTVGTRIELQDSGNSYTFTLVDAADGVTLAADTGLISLSLGEERDLDLNGDEAADLKVLVRDIDASAGTVVLRLDKSLYEPELAVSENPEPAIGAPQVASRSLQPRVLYRAASPEVITMVTGFRGNCLFRYTVDSNPREERFFQKDEALRLSFSNTLRIWASNGGAVQGRIKGEDVSFGRAGQVVAWFVKWRIVEGQYELVLFPVY